MKAAFTRGIRISGAALALGLVLCGCATISEHSHAYLGTLYKSPAQPGLVRRFARRSEEDKL